jgi:hypothetical protein
MRTTEETYRIQIAASLSRASDQNRITSSAFAENHLSSYGGPTINDRHDRSDALRGQHH